MALPLGAGIHRAIRGIAGLSMDTLQLGVAQLQGESSLPAERIRRPGGGRKLITEIYFDLVPSLLKLVEEDTKCSRDSMGPLITIRIGGSSHVARLVW